MASAILIGLTWLSFAHGLQGGVKNLKFTGGTAYILMAFAFDLAIMASVIKLAFFS